jgi:hypothetical protein
MAFESLLCLMMKGHAPQSGLSLKVSENAMLGRIFLLKRCEEVYRDSSIIRCSIICTLYQMSLG